MERSRVRLGDRPAAWRQVCQARGRLQTQSGFRWSSGLPNEAPSRPFVARRAAGGYISSGVLQSFLPECMRCRALYDFRSNLGRSIIGFTHFTQENICYLCVYEVSSFAVCLCFTPARRHTCPRWMRR